MRQHFQRSLEVNVSVEALFGFHERPDVFALLMPPWEPTEVLLPPRSLAIGTQVKFRTRIGPISVLWEAEHVELERNVVFADQQMRGPFAYFLHRHLFQSLGEGRSRMTDSIEYALPLGLLGRAFGGAMVRRRLDRMFEHRHAVTRRECEERQKERA